MLKGEHIALLSQKKSRTSHAKKEKSVNVHPWLDELKANANSIFDNIGIGRVF